MRNLVRAGLLALALSGCSSVPVGFEKAEGSGVTGHKVSAGFVGGSSGQASNPVAGASDATLTTAIGKHCVSAAETAVAATLLPVVGKLFFDHAMENHRRNLEVLKKSSQAAYSARIIADTKAFRAQNCVAVVREKDKQVKFVALLKIEKHGQAFVIEPLYIRAYDAVAVTKSDSPEIAVSVAVSVKTIGNQPNTKVPALTLVGEGSVTVPKIAIAGEGKICGSNECGKSDLVPYPTGGPSSITIAVTESGNVGFDLDAATAELKAIKEALGPALAGIIKERLEKD